MKLSSAQQKIIDTAKREIDEARNCDTYEDYFMQYIAKYCNALYNTPDKYKSRDIDGWNKCVECWKRRKSGIVLAHCNSKTLYKLEEYGLIEILEDSNGQNWGVDKIKLLNY